MSRDGVFMAEAKSAENSAQTCTQSTHISWGIVLFLLLWFCQRYTNAVPTLSCSQRQRHCWPWLGQKEHSCSASKFLVLSQIQVTDHFEGPQVFWGFFWHSLHLHATRRTFKAQSFCWVLRNASPCSFPLGWWVPQPCTLGAPMHTGFCWLFTSTKSYSSTQDILSCTMGTRWRRQNILVSSFLHAPLLQRGERSHCFFSVFALFLK